jgi:aminopeptidase N
MDQISPFRVVRLLFSAMALAASSSPSRAQEPAPGIAHDLAIARKAMVSDVSYDLAFELAAGMSEVAGEATIRFALSADAAPAQPLVLDFDGTELSDVLVNGVDPGAGVQRVHDHLVVAPATLVPGANEVSAKFTSKVAATGTPLSVFRDATRREEYLYTLLVPSDAHRLFPCFDQPDLKAVFRLQLTVPTAWAAVANAPAARVPEVTPDGRTIQVFAPTEPLSTYLLAFAAGPFEVIEASAAETPKMRAFVRKHRVGELDRAALFAMHGDALRWLGRYFGRPYPFAKLDVVLVPDFPYGGMEHAGAIFYRESAVVFDHPPTESELVRRSTLVYHEVSHQWFGNLVTMRWFDDLWLKEGFATFCSYALLDALEPKRNAWLRFQQRVKPEAYRVDATPGTTPIYQELDNLAEAKSAYGAIVYNKAPAVLRELHERIGAQAFRDGVRLFLSEHELDNADWSDLVDALERASGAKLDAWSSRWILGAGMPRVQARWETDAQGRVASFTIAQEPVQGGAATWPLQTELLRIEPDGSAQVFTVRSEAAETRLAEVEGRAPPEAVLFNPRDTAYGLFLLDAKSQDYWLAHAGGEADPLRRAVALAALFDMVRECELAPARYAELAIALLRSERDPQTHAWLLDTLATTLTRYLEGAAQQRLVGRVTADLLEQLHAGMPGLELQTFRFLARNSAAPEVITLCRELLTTGAETPGLTLGPEDRYLALAALIAAGKAGDLVAAMTGDATPAGSEKHAFVALAAAPDADNKDRYFDTYLQPDEPPEQWVQESLHVFHWRGQDAPTLPFLRRALDRVDWVKAHRKIFFMPAWVDAFVNGHSDRAALEIVDRFLADRPDLDADIRRKIEQSRDGLRRAVAIKARWQ